MMQQLVLWISLVGMFLVGVVFLVVRKKSTERSEFKEVQEKWYKARKVWFFSLVGIMGIATAISLTHLPYHHEGEAVPKNTKVIKVEAMQFGWNLSDEKFKAGEPVEFQVTSSDVNHGFGIYDENDVLLAEVQAMPGYTNALDFTFKKPGTYKILCLEYCGIGHHMMIKEIKVLPNGGIQHGNH